MLLLVIRTNTVFPLIFHIMVVLFVRVAMDNITCDVCVNQYVHDVFAFRLVLFSLPRVYVAVFLYMCRLLYEIHSQFS